MSIDTDHLATANTCHDAEPARAAELLRQIDPAQLPVERRPVYAHLLNHVLGEKLAAWGEALTRQQQLIALAPPAPALALWRQLGAAAFVTDSAQPLAHAVEGLVTASGVANERAHELLSLAAATYLVPAQPIAEAAQTALNALGPVTHTSWPTESALDAQAAACLNNLANGLLERAEHDLHHGALRAALARSAEEAYRLWMKAGTWVQLERALYVRALACTVLGEPHLARRHATDGLAVLDAKDSAHAEEVDRAFLELERWNACVWLGLNDEAHRALTRAEAIAATFDDASLTAEFESRRQRLPGFRR
ncbi:MAG: hypothetical protein H7Y33_11300 [Cytophagales bacterium]|nr:hypothetical protein [Rhizobacter sp.]